MAAITPELFQKLLQHIKVLIRRNASQHAIALDEHALQRRVNAYYLPLFSWIMEVVKAAQKEQGDEKHCVCIGLSCPQGGGKTTLSYYFQEAMALLGVKCAIMSLDDVYLTYDQQVALAKANFNNPLLQYRGNPGTMDVPFLMNLVKECKTSAELIALPRFDKSRHNGRGDRAPFSDWDRKQGPLDVLLIEGWCMGFQAIDDNSPDLRTNMKTINKELRAFEKFYKELDGLVVIKIDKLDWIYEWRDQPEQMLRDAKKPAMTRDEVHDFVDRFMPSYKTYLKGLYTEPKASSSPLSTIPRLVFSITSVREPQGKPVEYNFTSDTLK
ncbi:uncharacterized protein CCR75_000505 [Bremia lactucae]|uniref:Phosphoribulokinase/uridine kinase domain-containing protein n=1 Tax=Bremia lactucae TaxID=4779 RepID=A0A976FPZ6_BRELC|nr:hypothetical protein CCR75_000505 [Bremia lactucae]